MSNFELKSPRFSATGWLLRGAYSLRPAALVITGIFWIAAASTMGATAVVWLLIDGFGQMPQSFVNFLSRQLVPSKTATANNTAPAGDVSPVMVLSDGTKLETPEDLGRITGLFNVEHVQRDRANGGLVQWVIAAQNPRDPKAVARTLEAFYQSVRYERFKRGHAIRNNAGQPFMTMWAGDGSGVIVEEFEQDDGAVKAVIATGVTGCVLEGEYAKGEELELAGAYVHWTGQVAGTAEYIGQKMRVNGRGQHKKMAVQPLYTLKLEEKIIRAAVSNSNPLAPPSTVHGDAAFAWWDDLQASRATRTFWGDDGRRDEAGAWLGYFSPGRWIDGDNRRGYVTTTGEGHSLTVGPPGSGKFTANIAPLLLTADAASAVVFDVKNGEAAKKTGRHRAKLGRVLVLDPFGISGQPSGALNPLDTLRADDPMLIERAKRLVDALFVTADKSDSSGAYFDNSAKTQLTALLVHVATAPEEEGQRTLKRLREIIRRPYSDDLLGAMNRNEAAGGIVRDEAENIVAAMESGGEKNTFYVQQTLRAQTEFLDLPTVQAVTATTTLDPAVLRQEVATLYVVVPESELRTLSRWLRLVYASIMDGVRSEGVPLHVVIDEFPALGSFPRVVEDMARVRSLGIRMHVVVQSLAQLQQIYGRGWETFTANARYLKVLGANDDMTQRHVSGRLGQTTVRVRSDSTNRSNAGGGSAGSSFSFQGVPLMTPDQVGRLDAREMLVIVEGEKPLRLEKIHGYESVDLKPLGDF